MGDFLATIDFLDATEGGRTRPVRSGYRPNLRFDGSDIEGCAMITLLDRETAAPGSRCDVIGKFVLRAQFEDFLKVGAIFSLREGPRAIATGHIVELSQPGEPLR